MAKKAAPTGNEENAALLRRLQMDGLANKPAGGGGGGADIVNLKEQARELIQAAMQLDAKAAQAKKTKQIDLANTFEAKAGQFRRRAEEIMALAKI